MKKDIRLKIVYFLLGVLVTFTSTVFAYTLLASDVGFTPNDNEWEVENTKDALDSLRRSFLRAGILVKTINSGGQTYIMKNNGYILGSVSSVYNSASGQVYFNGEEDDFTKAVVNAQYNIQTP